MTHPKTVLITGSTSGIGLGIAEKFASQGMNIIVNGFGPEKEIKKICDDLKTAGSPRVMYSDADMTKPSDIDHMCAKALQEFGTVDILVNNAGIQFVSPIEDFPDHKWDDIIAINLSSAFHTTKHLIKAMKANDWGRIINIASAHGLVASPYKSAYIAAKHGLIGMTKTIALEAADHGITANAICPGYVLTPLVENQIGDQAKAHNMSEDDVVEKVILAPQAVKKFAKIEEIAELAAFLAGDAAQGITGSAYSIDGGWTAR